MRNLLIQVVVVAYLFAACVATAHSQPGKREPVTPKPVTAGARSNTAKSRQPKAAKSKAPEIANVIVATSPPDALLFLNGQQMEGPILNGIKPGGYVLTVRRVGYTEESLSITLTPGENVPITVNLEPLKGVLSIAPNVAEAQITLQRVDSKEDTKRFVNKVDDLSLTPGEYEVSIEKDGYRGVKRKITIRPAGGVYLEPQLNLWPKVETRAPAPAAMNMQVLQSGKYFTLNLVGGSGIQQSLAALDVLIDPVSESQSRVSGLLTGLPCRLTIIPIDNVNDYSVEEVPRASNDWKRISIKLRPKNSSLPLHLSIKCGAIASEITPATNDFVAAVARKKLAPTYPAIAKNSRVNGVVLVTVEIDERGRVTSAKAISGPDLLRQPSEQAARRWEFTPAKRNGVPVSSSQELEFRFEPQAH